MLDSLRAKLGSALELLRLYQHKLQVLESMPVCAASETAQTARHYSRCQAEGCRKCPHINPEATSAGPCGGPKHDHAAAPDKLKTGDCSHLLAPGNMQPSAHSLPKAAAIESPMQLGFCFDPSVGGSGALLYAPLPAPTAQPVGTPSRESATQFPHDSGTLGGHPVRCGNKSCDAQTRASSPEQGASSGERQKELAEDPWAFMGLSHCEAPTHAVRPFHGDLLSLVSGIDEMMSSSGKAPTEPSDTLLSDSYTGHRTGA